MHQKGNQSAQASSGLHHDDDDDDGVDPFADAEHDLDDDDDGTPGRGSWWRGMLNRNRAEGNDSEGDDDDEFGDFAMAEDDKSDKSTDDGEKVVLKPLAVNPAKESTRTLSGLWPFGSKYGDGEKTSYQDQEVVKDVFHEKQERDPSLQHAVEVREAKSRTSIEDPDDDDEYGAELMAGTRP
ncbi:hypothetical protein B0I35DRAFT_411426 [Stachybotrys elegans]|uniref:Uncharacterized protein n=1 Tax=Stachybotrys elegans TaxID=80388 RepID=A0A8K0WQL4_9HYPO|nr:hypothetical protein B0I35DRAFT_411426 [Stachybotrys elegans]